MVSIPACHAGHRGSILRQGGINFGHRWKSKDELISDVLLWTPTYGQAKAGRPTRTYIQQLCEDTGCSPVDLPEAMNDREKWRERVRDIRVSGTIWWWWFRFVSFPMSLAQCEMQLSSSSIWTRVANFIFYGNNRYASQSRLYCWCW